MRMLADKTNMPNIKPAYDKLVRVNTKIADHFNEELILASMQTFRTKIRYSVMSK
jgi:hypothetical protein